MPRKPPAKKANGHGTQWFNPKRDRYEYRMTAGYTPDGKPIRRTATAKTQDELAERIKALTETVAVNPTAVVGMTVAQWFDEWFSDILPNEPNSQSQKANYRAWARLYVLPYVGAVVLADLRPQHVRKMLTAIRDKGKSATTQIAAYRTLHRALNLAVREGYIATNVASLVDPPAANAKKGKSLTFDQSKKLLAFMRDHDAEAQVVTLLLLGMRPGELGGLTWADIDLDGNRLWIRRTIHQGTPQYVTDNVAKTDRSIRGIPVPPYLADVLRRHRVKQSAERLAFGAGWGNDFPEYDFVFTGVGGSAIRLDRLRKQVRRATNECGLGEWNPYGMRHSAISLMAAAGSSSKMISEIAGNSPRIAEAVYMHTMEDAKVEAVNAYAALIAPAQ